ncbi:hypothetical protein HDU82_007764 [Entophlyctis luteolus]|nr:hypothetical protein HDU82_007764 [Entophlyctis luteolus]
MQLKRSDIHAEKNVDGRVLLSLTPEELKLDFGMDNLQLRTEVKDAIGCLKTINATTTNALHGQGDAALAPPPGFRRFARCTPMGSASASDTAAASPSSNFKLHVQQLERRFQALLDSSTPHWQMRWATTAGILLIYFVRVFLLSAYYVVTYSLGIYLVAFLRPKFDTAVESMEEGSDDVASLPVKADEFRPVIRQLPEFKFWVYFLILFGFTMKQRIKHMIKYKYVPWNFGKKSYGNVGGE